MAWIKAIIESLLNRRQTSPLSRAAANLTLERRGHSEAERLARFPQQEARRIGVLRQVIGIVTRRLALPPGEHGPRNRNRRICRPSPPLLGIRAIPSDAP